MSERTRSFALSVLAHHAAVIAANLVVDVAQALLDQRERLMS